MSNAEIAAEAGLAKGTLYLYFRSKKDIYLALMQRDMEALKTSTLKRMDAVAETKEKICAFILARLENADTNRAIFRIMDAQPASLGFSRSQYRDWLKEPVLHLAEALEAAQQRGEIRILPAERVAWAVADMARGAVVRRLVGPPSQSIDEEAAFVVDLVWAALRLDQSPRK